MPKISKFPPIRKSPIRVVALLHDHAFLFELGIAAELFGLARPELDVPWYSFRIVSTASSASSGLGALTLTARAGLIALKNADLIVVPGWMTNAASASPRLIKALRHAHNRGARFFSICSGAFLLAHAGLLDGCRATTHWRYCGQFAQCFPNVRLEPNVLYLDEGQILTSAGSAAGIDAGLYLIAKDYGTAIANQVARRLLVTPYRNGGQKQFIPLAIPRRHSDHFSAVLKWMESHLDETITLGDLAKRAVMSERTFLRRFSAATGSTPKAWLQRLRINRAQELLEFSTLSADQISAASGFAAPETFRVAFKREVGLSPAAYRRQFQRNTRSFWKRHSE